MRIFKNRGDIYFSKTNKERSKEQRFLIIALVLIVIFTIAFVAVIAVKNNFSAKEFFKPENVEITQQYVEEEAELPAVSGKTNYAVMVNSEDNLLFVSLIQIDLDNISYKCATLSADTISDGNSLADIYKRAGAENVKNAVETMLNTYFDYYIDMTSSAFSDFYDEMGNMNYPILNEIRHKNNSSDVPYSLKIKAGEQKINGDTFVKLTRYYVENSQYTVANDLMLNSLLQHMNSANFERSEKLFSKLVTTSATNISVRDFSMADDALTVLTNDRTGVTVYGADIEYKNNEFTKKCLKSIKGYFAK